MKTVPLIDHFPCNNLPVTDYRNTAGTDGPDGTVRAFDDGTDPVRGHSVRLTEAGDRPPVVTHKAERSLIVS